MAHNAWPDLFSTSPVLPGGASLQPGIHSAIIRILAPATATWMKEPDGFRAAAEGAVPGMTAPGGLTAMNLTVSRNHCYAPCSISRFGWMELAACTKMDPRP